MASPQPNSSDHPPTSASHLLVAVAWLFVGIPAGWGVYQTALKSTALFKHAPPQPVQIPEKH